MLFDPTSPANKFGYFTAGNNFSSYSQFEAQEYAARTGNKVAWHFNDEFFSTIDWTVEPKESLKELYAERARQIRNDYDYIVLCFSGGSDSHNILSAFSENNIYIDELLTFHYYDGVGDKLSAEANMVEITLAAIPEANKYIEKFPRTFHRIVDISHTIKQYWQDNLADLKYNFMYYNNFYITPSAIVSTNLPTILPEYRKLTESGKRVCFIHATDKPYVQVEQGRWYFSFQSSVIGSSFSIQRQFEKTPVNDVLFYWDPDAWKIVVKQAHALKNYIHTNHSIVKDAITGEFKNYDTKFASTLHFFGNAIPANIVKNVIYPYWRNDIVDIGKETMNLYGVKSRWWSKSNLPGAKEHQAGIQHVAQMIGANMQAPVQTGYPSKRYYF